VAKKKKNPVFPTKKVLVELVQLIKKDVREYGGQESEWDDDDADQTLTLTVGADGEARNQWSFQTGDNSVTGGAYFYPYWAVVEVGERDNAGQVADDILDQLSERWYSSNP
jgi:hypothetical protein